ncbi:MAG: DNA double-strand break repair nuclease NurA [Candidatus Micrarchaeota archaeon]|nr:DNA double-strand break repair nuclease NurA [Candidatus Micrarchaeota archaeon]
MELDLSVVDLAQRFLEREDQWASLAARLRFNSGKIQYSEALESDLIYPVPPRTPDGTFAAVDGGLGTQEFHGLDLLVLRALAVQFKYDHGKLVSHAYYPSSRPHLQVQARSGLDAFELTRFTSLHRLRAELSAAYGALEKWKPSYLLLDGSLAPLVSDKPPDDSDLLELYTNVVQLYQKLYAGASAQGCNLVGVTKDSRGRRFMDLISRAVPESAPALANASDTAFLDHLLKEGERTFAFRYSVQPAKNPVLQDLGEWAGRILTFYLKPVAGDRPLRIEFLSTVSPFADIASVMAGLSALHPHYAYPAILIEADLRAALETTEVEHVVHDLSARVGRKRPLMPLRRDSRPFR